MQEDKTILFEERAKEQDKSFLEQLLQEGARKLLQAAVENEVIDYIQAHQDRCDENGCLEKDKEVLFTFYDFPAQHWPHIRTTNPIESTFATVRLRTHRTKGMGSRIATLTMVFKLVLQAQKHWRRLHGFQIIPKVISGVRFIDGEEQTQQAA